MSLSFAESNIARTRRELASLADKSASESKRIADATGRIAQAQAALTRASSESTARMKASEISRYQGQITDATKKQADIASKTATKTKELHRYEDQAAKYRESDSKKAQSARTELDRRAAKRIRELENRVTEYRNASLPVVATQPDVEGEQPDSDFLICHASEDKKDFVAPLAEALTAKGVKIWYDDISLKWGDSLRQKIEQGLRRAKFGIVVISKSFFKKKWTQAELDGLFALEFSGALRILPIWHDISKDEVLGQSPILADRKALNSAIMTVDEIANEVEKLVDPDTNGPSV